MTNTNTTSTVTAEGAPPGVYGWTIDGEPWTGGIERYAQARAGSFYAGIPIGPLYQITATPDGDLTLTPVNLRLRSTQADDWLRVHLQAGTDTATYRIDLRH